MSERLNIGELCRNIIRNKGKKRYYNLDNNKYHLEKTKDNYNYVNTLHKFTTDDKQLYNDVISLLDPDMSEFLLIDGLNNLTIDSDSEKEAGKKTSIKSEKMSKSEGKKTSIKSEKTKKEDKPKKEVKPEKDKSKRRENIPKKIRDDVWLKFHGKHMNGSCYVCEGKIDYMAWECGHIIADAEGGRTEINNLVTLCKACNRSMGKRNLNEYKEKYYSKN